MGQCRPEAPAPARVRAPAQASRLQHRPAADSSPQQALRGRPPDHRAPVPARVPVQAPAPARAGKGVLRCQGGGEGGELQPVARAGAHDPAI